MSHIQIVQESCAIAKMTARCALYTTTTTTTTTSIQGAGQASVSLQKVREPLRRYGYSKSSKMATAVILNLFESKIAPLEPPSRKPHPRTKHEVDRITRCRDMAIRVCWGNMEPPFWGEGEVVGVTDGTIRKSDGGLL